MSETQLLLIDTAEASRPEVGPNIYRLDERTRELGRRGVAAARAALRDAARPVAA